MKDQVAAAVNYMQTYGPLTRLIAQHSLDIANITAVIADARRAGARIETVIKRDPKGRKYASYRMQANG